MCMIVGLGALVLIVLLQAWAIDNFKTLRKKLSTAQAGKAAKQAEAMMRSGVAEGVAIATANKQANKALGARRPK